MNLINKALGGDTRIKSIKKNIAGSLVVKGVSIATQLMLVPLTLNYVSSETYGVWLTLSSIILWLSFFDAGFSLGLKNKLAEAIALGDFERGQTLVSTTYFIMMIIFLPLLILLESIVPYIDWYSLLNISASYQDDVISAMRIIVACFCIQMIIQVLSPVAAAYQKVALSSAFPVIGNVVSLFIIYILTKTAPPSLFILSLAISLVPVIILLLFSFYYYNNDFFRVSPHIKSIDLSFFKILFSLGYKFFLIQIQLIVLFQTTNFLMSNLSGPDSVTAYNVAYKYLGTGMMIFYIILSPFWPAFTEAYAKKDYDWMKRIYAKLSKVYFFVVIGIVSMLAVSGYVYEIWIGKDVDVPFVMSLSVALYMIIQSWFSLQTNLINGIGAISLQTLVSLVGMIVHIPLSLFLGRYVGAVGVVCSMIIITLLYSAVFTIQIRKILNGQANGIWII